MATHSSVLVWRLTGTGEPGGLLSMGSHRVGHDWSDLAAAAAAAIHEIFQARILFIFLYYDLYLKLRMFYFYNKILTKKMPFMVYGYIVFLYSPCF